MSDTLFVNPKVSVYNEDVSDSGEINYILSHSDLFAVSSALNVEALELDDGDTRTYSGLTLASNRYLLLVVEGRVRVETTAKDYDGVTNITGFLETYGVHEWPGYLLLSTYNVTALTLRGLADETSVRFFHLIL